MNNLENFKFEISSWLKEEIEVQNKKALLVSIENNSAYSLLNYYLCKSTQVPVHAIINASDSNARQLCIKHHIPHSAFDPFITHVDQLMINVNFPGMNKILYVEDYNKINELEKTIFISYVAQTTNSLFVGNTTRNDFNFVRNFHKVNVYDLLPFINFSETQLLKILKLFPEEQLFLLSNPNIDLEWAFDVNKKTESLLNNQCILRGIIESDIDPTRHAKWFSYTASQKALIAKLHQQEKLTRFKKINGKTFDLNEK